MMLFKRIKIRSYETGLYFRDGEFKGLLGEGRHWLFDLLRQGPRRRGQHARCVAGSRQARHDRQVGCAEGPRGRDGPEGPPAWSGLDRRPLQPPAGAGPVRLLARRARRACRGDRCPPGAVRARGPEGHRERRTWPSSCSTSARSIATAWAYCSSTDGTSTRCGRVCTRSGRARRTRGLSKSTCARPRSTSAVRRS